MSEPNHNFLARVTSVFSNEEETTATVSGDFGHAVFDLNFEGLNANFKPGQHVIVTITPVDAPDGE